MGIDIVMGVVLTGCISLNVGGGSVEKSSGVEFTEPAGSFERLPDTRADRAWLNRSNGNSISYLSTCNDPADPSLETATNELFAGLSDLKVVRSSRASFNGRDALTTEVEGKLEGVQTRIRAMVFKKNGCLYTVSYVGIPDAFVKDLHHFENFLQSFEAP